jgi:hypothetical protein
MSRFQFQTTFLIQASFHIPNPPVDFVDMMIAFLSEGGILTSEVQVFAKSHVSIPLELSFDLAQKFLMLILLAEARQSCRHIRSDILLSHVSTR